MGLFITLEGIDGAGKSTQARLLAERLSGLGFDPVLTREPGGSPGAEEIRKLLVDGDPGRWSPDTEILLFTAARKDHVERTITPALRDGRIVICDRYVDSTRAYQGLKGRRRMVDALHDLMIGLDPHITLIFDLDPRIGLARARKRGGDEDRFEQKGIEFQQDLRAAFQTIAFEDRERCQLIVADRSPEEMAEDVWRAVSDRIEAL